MEKEMQERLADLEFEYYVARISKQDEDIIKHAKSKYKRQLNKVLKMQKNKEFAETFD